jgi:hypothetical protein
MLKSLEKYEDISVGDTVTVETFTLPFLKRGKILEIYQTEESIRCVVRLSNGSKLDVHVKRIKINKKKCDCEIMALMRAGCLCGGS